LLYRQAILALSEGKVNKANEYIEKYKSIGKENSWSADSIATNLALIYTEADILDSAEFYYQKRSLYSLIIQEESMALHIS